MPQKGSRIKVPGAACPATAAMCDTTGSIVVVPGVSEMEGEWRWRESGGGGREEVVGEVEVERRWRERGGVGIGKVEVERRCRERGDVGRGEM